MISICNHQVSNISAKSSEYVRNIFKVTVNIHYTKPVHKVVVRNVSWMGEGSWE